MRRGRDRRDTSAPAAVDAAAAHDRRLIRFRSEVVGIGWAMLPSEAAMASDLERVTVTCIHSAKLRHGLELDPAEYLARF